MPQAASSPHRPLTTIPINALVMATNEALADKNFRDSVREMHAKRYPLVAMIDALGLEDDLTAGIRKVLEELPDDVVAEIRAATIAMLDSCEYEMPIDCTVGDAQLAHGVPIDIEVVRQDGKPTIRVRPQVNE
jgi:hypothetical protein